MSLLTLFGPVGAAPVFPAADGTLAVTKFTDILGTPQAQPGRVMPGYYTTGIAVWKGPFACEVPQFGLDGKHSRLRIGDQVTVPLSVAVQIAQSDPDWWELH